jgi:ribonucleoside-diphosphate reductase alpha chain
MSALTQEIKKTQHEPTLTTTLYVLKRDNVTQVPYVRQKIKLALTKAFLSVVDQMQTLPQSVISSIDSITMTIETALNQRAVENPSVCKVETIQDMLEKELMDRGYHLAARNFILYREERHRSRAAQPTITKTLGLNLKINDELLIPLTEDYLHTIVQYHTQDLNEVHPELIVKETIKNVYNLITFEELYQAIIMATRGLIETEPQYTFVAARLLLTLLKQEVCTYLDVDSLYEDYYQECFIQFIQRGITNKMLDPAMNDYDLTLLAKALKPSRDAQFQYLGIQTLYDRYFIHDQKTRYELPQVFFMRIAMGLSLRETNKTAKAIEFYELLSSFDFMSSTPTLFNSGTTRPQLSSCYLTTVSDDLFNIYGAIRDNAMLSKFAGGLGNDWSNIRGMNSHIKGTNGYSQGVIPFLKVVNDTAIAVNQGGKRKGAVCAYLEAWHRDIEEFLELRKNTGDDRRRTHDMNTAIWVPDLFMERLMQDGPWTLFSPDETPNLHDLYGKEFKVAYEQYEALAQAGELKNTKTFPAKQLWRKVLAMIFETGHPWVTFKDPCNLRSPQQHAGVVHSSNLCTEITLNTNADEIAVCNLGSVNLVNHLVNGAIDEVKLQKTIKTAVRMLDNVIDINYYSVDAARNSNLRHRPIGLGVMGFQDVLYLLNIPYASQEAIEFADRSMELMSYFALETSADLAQERGSYESFQGSLWSKGVLPIDSLDYLAEHRPGYVDVNKEERLNWNLLREKIKKGMRNSNVLAIAPTATIANICGVSQSIEPAYQNLYVKSNLSGEFTVINPYLVAKLKENNLWDKETLHALKYFDGQLQKIERIPSSIKNLFATAFEIQQDYLIEAASRRQKWIDQSQSLNLYINKPSGKLIDHLYKFAWLKGLKTTYYCRTLGATDTEKSTIHDGKLNAVAQDQQQTPAVCSIDNPECESCQ